jgi:hypothetical protein
VEQDHHDEGVPSGDTKWKSNEEVKDNVEDDTTSEGPWNLCNDLRTAESHPSVDTAWILATKPDIPVVVEHHGTGADELGDNHEDQKAGENAILKIGNRIPQLEENQTIEE